MIFNEEFVYIGNVIADNQYPYNLGSMKFTDTNYRKFAQQNNVNINEVLVI